MDDITLYDYPAPNNGDRYDFSEEELCELLDEVYEKGCNSTRLLSLDEIKFHLSPHYLIVWLEERLPRSHTIVLTPSKITYPYPNDEENDYIYQETFGSDLIEKHYYNSYGKNWRCWTNKPSKEQQKTIEWEK